jgi:hypothetical protein
VTLTVDGAFAIVKVLEPESPRWFESPPYVADAVAVPALTLVAYEIATAVSNPPEPAALAVHGSMALPVYVRESGHVTVTRDGAFSIMNVLEALSPK